METMKISSNTISIDTTRLYRMPWSFSDNAFSWIEPTRNCNLACEYCYQEHESNSDKSLRHFARDLRSLLSLRKCDVLNIAGGEPLLHPRIHEIVSLVRSHGVKPQIVTNGMLLTTGLARSLRAAGAASFMIHVDALQNRPGWRKKDELQLNELRQHYADMVHDVGGLVCGFTTTVVPSMLHQMGGVVEWTLRNSDRVAAMMLIPVRLAETDPDLEYYAGNERIDPEESVYAKDMDYRSISAAEIYAEIRKSVPDLEFNAYLGGTILPTAPKWAFANPVTGRRGMVYGFVGPRSMEMLQQALHLFRGRYPGLLHHRTYHRAGALFALAPVDAGLRKALRRYLGAVVRNPLRLFDRLHFQSIIVMQPQDMLENGDQDQCDGCPNKTLIGGRLVSECRGDDFIRYGRMVQAVRRRPAEHRWACSGGSASGQLCPEGSHPLDHA